jgi:heptosyltransferase-1
LLCAAALGYELTSDHFYGLKGDGLAVAQLSDQLGLNEPTVLFAHGSSRRDKCWPEEYWIELGRRFNEAGWRIALPHGSPAEHASSQRISDLLSRACVWPRLLLAELTDAMAACAGVVGVDSGLSHMAVALDLPHVQIYNLDTAWRTGPIDCRRQRSLYHHPYPDVDQVWRAWHEVSSA